MKNQTLIQFVKDECADYDKHYQRCVWDKPCRVLAGEKCGYFEKVVLCSPDYKYKLPGYDYAKLFAQYAEQTKTKAQAVEQRRCTCGNPLRHRQRYCEKCSKKRRLGTYRENRQKTEVDAPQLS